VGTTALAVQPSLMDVSTEFVRSIAVVEEMDGLWRLDRSWLDPV